MIGLVWMLVGLFGDTGGGRLVDVAGAPAGAVFWPRAFSLSTEPDPAHRGRRLAVMDLTGRELPARCQVVTRWPDGSPRWWRVTPGEWTVGRVKVETVRSRPRHRPARLRSTADGWSFAPRPGGEVTTWENGTLAFGRAGDRCEMQLLAMTVETDGMRATARPPQSELRTGPDGAGVEMELHLDFEAGCPVRCRVHWAASSAGRFLQVELCLTALEPTSLRRWTLPLMAHGDPVRATGLGQRLEVGSGEAAVLRAPRATIGEGAPSSPLAHLQVGLGSRALHLCWPQFAWRRPAALSVRDDGRVRLHLVDGDVFLDRGQTVRRCFTLARGPADAMVRERPRGVVRPRRRSVLAPETQTWLDDWAAFLSGWLQRRTWMEDFGCYATRHGTFANGEYDLGGSLLDLGQRLGDAELIRLGETLVRHTMDWDVAVDVPDPWPQGLFAHHGNRHASDRIEAGHLWVDGFVQLYRASGDTDGYGTARRVGGALADALAHRALFEGPERRLGWPLRAALDLHEVSTENAWPSLARSLVDRLVERQTAAGYLDGDRRKVGAGERVWVNVWVALGITIDGLLRAEERGLSERAGRLAADYGHFVLEHAWRDSVLAEVLLVNPDTGVVEERRGRCRKGGAALAAAGLAGLARRTGDPALFEAADTTWRKARSDLAQPREKDLVDWAKSLQALRRRLDLRDD